MKGWKNESARHALAARGIKTHRKDMMRKANIVYSKKYSAPESIKKYYRFIAHEFPDVIPKAKELKVLPDKEYEDIATKLNPRQYYDAITSNGFFDPDTEILYVRKQEDPIQQTRVKLHELCHSFSWINNQGFNEGFCDYMAKKVMINHLKLDPMKVQKSLDYPSAVENVEKCIAKIGEKPFTTAAFKTHKAQTIYDALKEKGVSPEEFNYEMIYSKR